MTPVSGILARAVGTAFGIGYLPGAPGTWASLAAALVFLFVPSLAEGEISIPLASFTAAVGVWAGTVMEREYGKDPSCVVVDEVAGQWLSLAALPASPLAVLAGFILFRLFDILKPGPVDRAQRLPGGWGIMADDLVAGLFANVSVRLLLAFVPPSFSFPGLLIPIR